MQNYKTFYRRNLPHYQPPGYTFFVTFRLNGSLPLYVITKLKTEYDANLKRIASIQNKKEREKEYYEFQSIYFQKFDECLDKILNGPKWLKEEKIANVVKEAMHYRDKSEYDLIAYTIMPNHVHVVFTPIVTRIADLRISSFDKESEININQGKNEEGRNSVSPYIVTGILQNLKKYTAVKCNQILKHSGKFWQHESYDHVVRDTKQLNKIVKYIIYNPVKAGLVPNSNDWPYAYYNPSLMI
jgi:REP element-mobilizing transposase RayT